MFWSIPGLSTSPVDTILEKEGFTLEELLDEDEIIQECKSSNSQLITFLQEKVQVEQLLRYIVEECPENSDKKRLFKFPFIACEIFTCEDDCILTTIVDNEELLDLLFSFLKPDHPHNTLLASYFCKVVLCLLARKGVALMNYIQGRPEIIHQLVDLIGVASMAEVLVRMIGCDENYYSNYLSTFSWMENTDILEIIVEKFKSSDSPEVHNNCAEVLCAISRCAPPWLAAKICSPSFIKGLLRHALDNSRPKLILFHSLSIFISMLDPKRALSSSFNHLFLSNPVKEPLPSARPEIVQGMLEHLGDLLKFLYPLSSENALPTTYGSLNPPLGMHRLKVIEFIFALLTLGSETTVRELIRLGAIKQVFDLFFKYPFNNFLHRHVENITISCLVREEDFLIEHLLYDVDIIGRIIAADKQASLPDDYDIPTVSASGRKPPRIGNVGHMTRIANKLMHFENSSSLIKTYFQENSDWVNWHANVLVKRNALENVHQWACGRPSPLQDVTREREDDDFRDRDYDISDLANNFSQAFVSRNHNYSSTNEVQGLSERGEEELSYGAPSVMIFNDVYFDDEVVNRDPHGEEDEHDQGSTIFPTDSDWYAFEEERIICNRELDLVPWPSSGFDDADEVVVEETGDLCSIPEPSSNASKDGVEPSISKLGNGPYQEFSPKLSGPVEEIEISDSCETTLDPDESVASLPNGKDGSYPSGEEHVKNPEVCSEGDGGDIEDGGDSGRSLSKLSQAC